jgi:hypothetical protein
MRLRLTAKRFGKCRRRAMGRTAHLARAAGAGPVGQAAPGRAVLGRAVLGRAALALEVRAETTRPRRLRAVELMTASRVPKDSAATRRSHDQIES